MNSRFRLNPSNLLFFMQSLLALLLATTGSAYASGTDIKDTNYPIPSGAYYVSPNGLDTNSGRTPDSPTTIVKAIYRAPVAGTIVFRGGTYRNIGGVYINKKLTLQPYPLEKAWIKGSLVVTGWATDGSIWRKDGWNYSFPSNVSSVNIDPYHPMAGYRDMVYVNDVSLKQVASKAEVAPGKFYLDSVNKQLYIGDNPTGKTVEATAQKDAFGIWKPADPSTPDPSDTIVRGLGFAHYADQAIMVGASRVTLENNAFVWNGVQGAYFSRQSDGIYNVSVDGIVRGNLFSSNGRKGLGGDQAHRLLVEGNTLSYNNHERFRTNWDAAGVKLIRSDALILRNNLVEYNYATGIWVDISSTNAKIVRNVVHHNEFVGIWFELSHKGLIGANVVDNNKGSGIYIYDSSDARVYNNTLANNLANLSIYDTTRKNVDAAQIAAGITWTTRNNVFKNNILSNASGTTLFDASNCEVKDPSASMIAYSTYNAYHRTSSNSPLSVVTWTLGADKCSVKYPSIDAFKSATGYEENALAIDNVVPNPFFVDEPNRDFRLKIGSPAIGRGGSLQPDSAAAIGVPAGVTLDLGALQSTRY